MVVCCLFVTLICLLIDFSTHVGKPSFVCSCYCILFGSCKCMFCFDAYLADSLQELDGFDPRFSSQTGNPTMQRFSLSRNLFQPKQFTKMLLQYIQQYLFMMITMMTTELDTTPVTTKKRQVHWILSWQRPRWMIVPP